MKAVAVCLTDENTVKSSHMFLLQRLEGFVLAQFVLTVTQLSVFGFCRVDLLRADRNLRKQLVVLQHALKHKEDPREDEGNQTDELRFVPSAVQEQVSASPSGC